MPHKIRKTVAVVAALGAIAVGASAFANAASNGGSSADNSTSAGTGTVATSTTIAQQQGGQNWAPPQGNRPQSQAQRPDETLLTGDTADKVKAAAEDKVSGGTVLRVETDSEGSPYEAHVRKSDGTEVTVKVDKELKVTAVEQGHGHP